MDKKFVQAVAAVIVGMLAYQFVVGPTVSRLTAGRTVA